MILSEKKQKISLTSSEQVSKILKECLNNEDTTSQEREHFWAIGLNVKNVVLYIELVSLGTLTASLVHPRELYRLAILKGVAALVIGHNHPSGDTRPSQEDLLLTKRLVQAGDILGIKILDHIIIGSNSTSFSFRDNGLLAS